MKEVITSENIPIMMWLDDIEAGALEQAKHLANLPFAFHHIALMPDTHQGYGMPIGAVLATENAIIPNAVGMDIGCGVLTIKTNLYYEDVSRETIKKIVSDIYESIPVGFSHRNKRAPYKYIPQNNIESPDAFVVKDEISTLPYQIGTLGGGNHFIEIQKDTAGFIWVMLHSGSRNLGAKIATYYNEFAKYHNSVYYSVVPDSWELAFLPYNSDIGIAYREEMNYAIEFAKSNRRYMMDIIIDIFSKYFKGFEVLETIESVHNYASLEHHFHKNVVVHRKGAILVRKGMKGIIPGSQGTKSYIVEGKGNPDSFESCSHGAGRRLGRRKARETLDLEEEVHKLDEKGIIHSVRCKEDLDEAPSAYKDISVVMENQKDLVNILVELEPLAVIKG